MESPGYEGHSLNLPRRVAKALSAKVRVVLEPEGEELGSRLAEFSIPYLVKRRLTKPNRSSLTAKSAKNSKNNRGVGKRARST